LIANVVHISLNARGGGERLAVATIKALSSMGIDVELASIERPDEALIRNAYGIDICRNIKKIRTLNILQKYRPQNYSITVNTHGDMLPFYHKDFTKSNSIIYCHYPLAGYLIDCNDPDYAAILHGLCLSGMGPSMHNIYYQKVRAAYAKMMLNSTVLTNSEFSRRAIFKAFGVDSTVLHPPVDVDIFRNACLSASNRDESILVISRFHPSKKIENVIHLAKLLSQNNLGAGMKVIGNISPNGIGYFNYLYRLVRHYNLEDFVSFEVNVRFDRLLDAMRRSKVYLHPLPAEPFGISTVEAMSAGMIPVVPDIGGHTEFVPKRYQFRTFKQGLDVIEAALRAPASERIQMSHSTQKYSVANYIKKFQQIVDEVLNVSKKPLQSSPVVSHSKKLQESMTP
jgi:glycosyltransferase involved in cell wall biosynthesis